MNQVGEKIDIENFGKTHFPINPRGTIEQLYSFGTLKVMSWGAHNWQTRAFKGYDNVYYLRFTVNGRLFKGHIYIVLNGLDLYDIYYCTNRGTIKMVNTNIYFDQMTDVIDIKIEKVPEYKQ